MARSRLLEVYIDLYIFKNTSGLLRPSRFAEGVYDLFGFIFFGRFVLRLSFGTLGLGPRDLGQVAPARFIRFCSRGCGPRLGCGGTSSRGSSGGFRCLSYPRAGTPPKIDLLVIGIWFWISGFGRTSSGRLLYLQGSFRRGFTEALLFLRKFRDFCSEEGTLGAAFCNPPPMFLSGNVSTDTTNNIDRTYTGLSLGSHPLSSIPQ